MGKGADDVLNERYREVQATGWRLSTRRGFSHVVLFHLVFERAVNDRDHDDSVILYPETLCTTLRTKQQQRSIMMLMQSVAKLSEETLSERRVKRRCKSVEKILCQRRSVKRL
jgi:hypothetical protein